MMISIIIFAAIILKFQLTLGQISESTTKCTSSSMTSCAYSQIRCPPNYYFNGQYCLPQVQAATATATPTQQPPPDPTTLPATICATRPPNTVPPKNPDPLPVKPVCERFYEWNGRECYKVLSNLPICPEGHNLTADGQCVSILQALCRENYYLNGDFCVGLLEAPVICPNNLRWDGTKCLYQLIPSCPDGFVLNNGFCEIIDAGGCPAGTFMDNFRCIGHHQIEIQCNYGYSWDGSNCVNSTNSCEDGFQLTDNVCEKYIVAAPDFECPPRTEMIGNQCVSAELICPKGFALINSICVEQISYTNGTDSFITPNCTTGYQLVGCECVKIDETTSRPTPTPTPICPPNYVFKDGLCYYEQEYHPPTCPTNHVIINGICVPLQPEVTETPPTPPSPPTSNCTQIDCQQNFTSTICNCPVGYTLNNGLCVLTGQISKVCPVGYQLINGICILTTQENTCQPGYHLSNGICLQTVPPVPPCQVVCPPNTQLINGVCVIAIDVGSGDCPPGYQKVDGNCVPIDNPEVNPCPTDYQWINGTCVNAYPGPQNPCYVPCPQGYYWENGICVTVTTVVPTQPGGPDENGVSPPTIISPIPPIVQPCPSINTTCQPCPTHNQPCQPCPTNNQPCQPCPTNNPPCQPCPTNNQPCQPCSSINPPCQPCSSINPPCQPCSSNNPPCQPCSTNNTPCPPSNNPPSSLPPNSGCNNCPHTTHYITKDGHISITNIVNVAHHHQRPHTPTQNHILTSENIDESFDYDNNGQNVTGEAEAKKNCCEITTPRQCKRNGDEWTCYHKKYERCGDICTQPKIYLKPKTIHYQPPILIMPPPPRRVYARRRAYSGGAVDCSGCIQGGYRCSVECYSYPDCRRPDCAFIDQHSYCEEWGETVIEGCSTDDGYFE